MTPTLLAHARHSNYDDFPLLEILEQEQQATTGQPIDPPGGG